MRAIDRFVNAVRAVVERGLPWYDAAEVADRRSETRRIHRRSIAARLSVEKLEKAYRLGDGALR
jgi:hypothetical protein